jgi:hypothetical protein
MRTSIPRPHGRKSVRGLLLFGASLSLILLPNGAAQQEGAKIAVSTSAARATVSLGEDLELRVELRNIGSHDVYVCKDFAKPFWPLCSLTFLFEGQDGKSGTKTGLAVDFPRWRHWDLSEVLNNDWIALRPGHFYGTLVSLPASSFPQLGKPGRYRILCHYSSGGILSGYQGTVTADSSYVASLPAKSWEGQAEATPIFITVVARPAQR